MELDAGPDPLRLRSSRTAALAEFLLGTLLVGLNVWIARGSFEPIARPGQPIAYVLVSPSFVTLFVCLLASAASLLALQLVARHHADPGGPLFSGATAPHLRSLRWTALSLAPMLLLVLPPSERLAPLSYALFDLRWYWWAIVAFETMSRAGLADVLWSRRQWPAASALAGLVMVPVAFSIAVTPHLRFSGALHGDEPKYIRFVENFYQGRGFDIADKPLLADASGPGYPRILNNFGALVRTIPEESAQLVNDARHVLTGAGSPPLRSSEPGGGMVFAGKHPGTVYQLHNPGISFLLFPAYVLDRTFTGSGVGYGGEFPLRMPAVHATLLTLFAGFALAIYALLRALALGEGVAWTLSLVGVLALPVSAFTFQIYPEVAAGLILCVLVRAAIVRAPEARAALGYGLLAGFLPWLHLRFGLATLVVAAVMLSATGIRTRPRLAFVAGVAIPLALLVFYTYHLTGSLIPLATYGSDTPLSVMRTLKGVPAFIVDRVWGLLPHAPIYVLALPGISLLWHRSRRAAIVVLLIVFAVIVPAAGHGFWAGGSTPGRYIVAVAPLLMVFVAESAAFWSHRRIVTSALIVLAMVSVQTAVRYNLHHIKEVGPLVAKEFSGWRVNLLFPSLGTDAWEAQPFDLVLIGVWLAIASCLLAAGWWAARSRAPASADSSRLWAPASAGAHRRSGRAAVTMQDVVAGLMTMSAFGIVMAAGRAPIDRAYLVPLREARERTLTLFTRLERCAVCFASTAGAVPPTEALGNDVGAVNLLLAGAPPVSGARTQILVRPRTPDGEFLVSTVRIDFGDGTAAAYNRWFGDVDERHVFKAPGEYLVHAWVKGSSMQALESRITVRVEAPSLP